MGHKAFFYLPTQTETSKFVNLFASMNFNRSWLIFDEEIQIRNEKLQEKFDFIILDRFKTPIDEIIKWKKIAPVIGFDEGGKYRDQFDFLIDMLIPEKMGKPKANITNPSLLFKKNFTTNHTNQTNSFLWNGHEHSKENNIKILITFGQEDPAGLGLKTVNKLLKYKYIDKMDITFLKGALAVSSEQLEVSRVKTIDSIPNLAEKLHEYDLVITHYGLTAYEALYAGVPVLLAHPTPYHKKLAKAAGFPELKQINSVHRFTQINTDCKIKENKSMSLVDLINDLEPVVNRQCPVCSAQIGKDTTRFNERTYRLCSNCGIIYMDRFNPVPFEYENEYFF